MKKVTIIIPVFRNAATLEILIKSVQRETEGLADRVEIGFLFVNDGSDDSSADIISKLKDAIPGIEQIELSRNFGQVPAIVAGLDHVAADGIIIMSADMQDPVSMVRTMILQWGAGSDIVIAHRQNRQDSLIDRVNSSFFYRLMNLSEVDLPDGGFDFVLLDRRAADALKAFGGRNRFLQGDILWLGFHTTLLPYERQGRQIGTSQWKKSKKLKYLIDGVVSTSYWPIRLMSVIGLLTALWGFIYTLIIVYMRVHHQTPFNGWAPIMVVLLMLGGLIMLMLGIIGEYIWRIYDEVRGRPYYIIKGTPSSRQRR
jgi:dolichol-phosphate mannosyltransferase